MGKKKTAIDKLNFKEEVKIVDLSQESEKVQKAMGGGMMVIPNPIDVYDVIKTIPYGKVVTTTKIRQILAEKYKVETACPLTTGIFVNICSKANHEFEEKNQKEKIVPTYRVLKKDNELNEKFPEGIEVQKSLLESEGHKIISKGRKKIRYFVEE